MKYDAVIFDLFGTLIDNYTLQEYQGILTEMALVLSVPPKDFIKLWYDTFNERTTGILPNPEANIDYVCQKLGVPIEENQRSQAAQIRFNLTVRSMTPVTGAIEVLSYLKSEGYKTGLITDCSSEVPAVWQDTLFAPLIDVTIFSCLVGLKKPDPRIYQLATEGLKVEPQHCLYIGDGSSQELTGAARVGMYPVLIHNPEEDSANIHRVNAEMDNWRGPIISTLKEVLTLVR